MTKPVSGQTLEKLKDVLLAPNLANARELEASLKAAGYESIVFGRLNQRSSVEANSESDRGIAERLANALDASLTGARLAVGIPRSDRSLTPRNAAQRFLCENRERCEWSPTQAAINFPKPVIEIWEEDPNAKRRYLKHHPADGLATILVRDFGIGISREKMPETILDLNSNDKLCTFEAIGQFGHGGSSSLHFCESALILCQPRFDSAPEECYWTLIYPEPETEDSKQELIRRWFADEN